MTKLGYLSGSSAANSFALFRTDDFSDSSSVDLFNRFGLWLLMGKVKIDSPSLLSHVTLLQAKQNINKLNSLTFQNQQRPPGIPEFT